MVLHLTADRKQAYVVSIPRDSYIRLYDETGQPRRMDKANAAFSLSGPTAYLATVENLTGLRMQHLAVVDWAGFEDIANALGGVEVYVPPSTVLDKSGAIKPGRQVLNGEQALRYVRTRYTLRSGDFGRIDRQQNFIRSLMRKLLDRGTLTNPFTLAPTLDAVARSLTVDESLDTGTMRNLALPSRGIRPADVTFVTAPFDRFDRTGSGASRLDPAQSRQLWRAVGDDDIESYLSRHGEGTGQLPAPRDVS
ncbi:MAG: LCP family protein [Actinomycetota bacterium]|nr:LCP family protein [Actinomycetota bacterium]